MKIATFNVNSIRARLDAVTSWLEKHQPDALCLQETKCQDADFPLMAVEATGYRVHFRGMKSYNGVAILTKEVPENVAFGFEDGLPESAETAEMDNARLMRLTLRGVTIVNTYVPNGFKLDTPQYAYKLRWYERLHDYFGRNLSLDAPAVWLGDMNVAPEPIDVHSPEKHLKHVCFHEDARAAYKRTAGWGFTDVFRKLHPDRLQYTFWDYLRPSSLEKNKGWRIDHVMATPPLAERCRAVDVDIEPRRAPRSSDHTFVWADFDI